VNGAVSLGSTRLRSEEDDGGEELKRIPFFSLRIL
jgi:hypothetical protein